MENKNTRTSKQTSIRSTQTGTPTSTRAPRMNTAEGIKELSSEIEFAEKV